MTLGFIESKNKKQFTKVIPEKAISLLNEQISTAKKLKKQGEKDPYLFTFHASSTLRDRWKKLKPTLKSLKGHNFQFHDIRAYKLG